MLVSIIIPCYNSEQYLEETLLSALNQTYPNIEIICVDNGSNDRTIEIVESFMKIDRRIILTTENRKGANFARNTGLKICRGEVVQFLDSDDLITPEKIKTQLDFLIQNNLDVVVSDRTVYDSNMKQVISEHTFQEIEKKTLETAIAEIIITGNPLYRKNTLIAAGSWNEDISSAQDWELNIRLALRDLAFGYCSGKFLKSRQLNASLSANWVKVTLNAVKVLDQNREAILLTSAMDQMSVREKIFYVYYMAALHSKNIKPFVESVERWGLTDLPKKSFKGANRLLYSMFGLKMSIRLKSLILKKG